MAGKVVIIDCSEYSREKAKHILKSIDDFEIVEIADAGSFYTYESSLENVELIIIDLALPTEKEGFKVLSSIRANPGTFRTPVIIATRLETPEYKSNALKFSVSDYIVKPYTSRRFESSIKALVKPKEKFRYDTSGIENITMSFEEYITKQLKLANRLKRPLSIVLVTSLKMKKNELITRENFEELKESAFNAFVEKARTLLRETDYIILNKKKDVLVILPGTDPEGAKVVSQKLKLIMDEELKESKLKFDDLFYPVCVTYPDDGIDFNSLMESAYRKIASKEMLERISSIPFDKRQYANKRYNQFYKWF